MDKNEEENNIISLKSPQDWPVALLNYGPAVQELLPLNSY